VDAELDILTACPIFRGLNTGQIARLLDSASYRTRQFGKGDVVARAGGEVYFQHIVISGSVKGEMIDFAGKVIKIEDILPPKPLAGAFLFGQQNRYPVNIIANEATLILSIPRDAMLKMMQEDVQVLKNFINAISNRGQFLSSKIKFLSFSTIRGKLAQYLLELSEKQASDTVELPHSQSQLAELFGVARPSVGRSMSEMNREGLISTRGKKVLLLDKAGLSSLLL
jgi:CRP-like cAMP-binding protein